MASVLVFCSSSEHVSPMFFSEARLLAEGLAAKGHRLVYGGAQVGIMGHLARTALAAGAEVVGVIPSYLNFKGMTQEDLTDLQVVPGLLDRKKKMLELADVVVAFPGGIGTIDEISEVLALRQLGETDLPVIFHNFLDHWQPFLDYLTELEQVKMVASHFTDYFSVAASADEVLSLVDKVNR